MLLLTACSDPAPAADSGPPPTDAGRDASAEDMDAGHDAGTDPDDAGTSADAASDAATIADAGTDAATIADAGTDAGSEPDAGTDAGSTPEGCGDLGKPCTNGADCGAGYECDTLRGVCMPRGRPTCGGFVGAPCPSGGIYTECRYYSSADFGPCLTPAEDACACRAAPSAFACP